jgi:DNA-binding MurR/RpiR family transcriptional regulator
MTKNDKTKPPILHRYQGIIEARLAELSTSEQTVAAHLMAHPHQLPFETANSLAKRLGVSGMTIGRALKALGYQGLGDIRKEMRLEVSDSAPWVERATARSPPALKKHDRMQALSAELEAIEGVHALGETRSWQEAARLIAAADQVFVTGFQTERGLAVMFADQLAYIRPRVRYIAAENRAFADIGTEGHPGSCLVMVDCRRYSRWFRLLGQRASALDMPLVIATDAYCSWAAKLTPYAFQVRTDSGRFWDNNAPIASLLNLLVEDVIEQLGDAVHSQLDAATEFGSTLIGFERVRRQPRSKKDNGTAQPKATRDSDRNRSAGTRLGQRIRNK